MEKYYVYHSPRKREYELSISNRIIEEAGRDIIKKLVDEWLQQLGIQGELHLSFKPYHRIECYLKENPPRYGEFPWRVTYTKGDSNVKIGLYRWEMNYEIALAK